MNTHLTTPLSPAETVTKLTETFKAKGMTIFAVIDHQQGAQQVGLILPPTTVIFYGNPKVGTPLMQQDPEFALQLPLKVLVTQNHEGQTDVIFERAQDLVAGSKIDVEDAINTLGKAEQLIQEILNKA